MSPALHFPYLAVSRSDASIELWNVCDPEDVHLERVIPGGRAMSVECLLWLPQTTPSENSDSEAEDFKANNDVTRKKPSHSLPAARLLSAGLDGRVIEWDLDTLKPKYSITSYGGAVWCMSLCPLGKTLLAGCEDGSIKVFSVDDECLLFVKSLHGPSSQERLLSLSWNPSIDGDEPRYFVSGSSEGELRLWDLQASRTLASARMSRLEATMTLVWSVLYLSSGFIVTADSLGHTSFWDARTLTLVKTFVSHESDVLCLVSAGSHEGNVVFASGVDYKITRFELCQVMEPSGDLEDNNGAALGNSSLSSCPTWVETGHRRCHSHDVRALCILDAVSDDGVSYLFSGGVDTNLIVHRVDSFPKTYERKLSCLPQLHPIVQLAAQAKCLLDYNHDNMVNLWQLSADNSAGSNDMAILWQGQIAKDHNIVSSCILTDASCFALGTRDKLRVFKRQRIDGEGSQYMALPALSMSVRMVSAFSLEGSTFLAVTTFENSLCIFKIEAEKVVKVASISIASYVTALACDASGRFIALGTTSSLLVFGFDGFDLDLIETKKIRQLISEVKQSKKAVRKRRECIGHMAWYPTDGVSPCLVVTMLSKTFFLYILQDGKHLHLDDWSLRHSLTLPPHWVHGIRDKIIGIIVPPKDFAVSSKESRQVILWGINFMAYFNMRTDKTADFVVKDKFLGDKEAWKRFYKRKLLNEDAELFKDDGEAKEQEPYETGLDDVHITHAYRPLLFAGFCEDNSLVVVERPWLSILKQLPEPFHRARYGN